MTEQFKCAQCGKKVYGPPYDYIPVMKQNEALLDPRRVFCPIRHDNDSHEVRPTCAELWIRKNGE